MGSLIGSSSKPKTMGAGDSSIYPIQVEDKSGGGHRAFSLWVEVIFFGEVNSMPTAEKAAVIEKTREALEQSQGTVLADYRGLTVQQLGQLRERLAKGGVTLKVIKNTLIKRAADEVGIEGLEPYLSGPTAVAFSSDDPVAAAKLLSQATREFRKMEIKGGVLGRTAISASGVKELADLPSREVLLSKVVGTLNAPIQQFVWVLNAPMTNLARALDQIRLQKENAG